MTLWSRQIQYKLTSGVTTKDILVPYVADQSSYTGQVTSLAAGHTYDITVSALSNHINGAEQGIQGTTSESLLVAFSDGVGL